MSRIENREPSFIEDRGSKIADCGLRIADLPVPRILLLLWRLLRVIGRRLAIRNPQSAIRRSSISEEVVMTLRSRKVFSSIRTVIIVLSLVSSPLAQTPRQCLGIQPPPPEPQQTEEEKKAAKELEKKALALIDEMV